MKPAVNKVAGASSSRSGKREQDAPATLKSTLTPKLRFPEFRDAEGWEACLLQEIAEFVGDRVSVSELNRADYVSTENLLPDFGGFSLPSSFPAGGSVVRYRARDILAANIRPYLKKIWLADRNGGASNDVLVIRAQSSIDYQYLSHVLKNDRFIAFVVSGAKGLKMPRGDLSLIREYPVPIPRLPEQQRIASCLSSLDDLIGAEGRKLDALKAHKKGLMQNIFPREGETRPRLRFPEFRGAGEWEEKTLANACEMQAGKFVRASDIKDQPANGLFPCYGGNGLRGYTATHTHDGVYSLIGRQGALCGNVKLCKGRFHATEHAVVATPEQGIDVGWLYYALDLLNLNRFATGQAQPGLSVDVLEKVALTIPACEDEQHCIASCLSSLDDLIAAQAAKIEALKTHKRGLMQQLFPAPEGVGG